MAVCGYALGASNPSGGININGSVLDDTDSSAFVARSYQGSSATACGIARGIARGSVGTWVAHKFGRIQESIAKQQSASSNRSCGSTQQT